MQHPAHTSQGICLLSGYECICSASKYNQQHVQHCSVSSQEHKIGPTLLLSCCTARLMFYSLLSIHTLPHCLLFLIVCAVSLPLLYSRQVSMDLLFHPFSCAGLETWNLSVKELKSPHFFQHQSDNLLCSHWSLWSWLNIAHPISRFPRINAVSISFSLHTHPKLQSGSCPSGCWSLCPRVILARWWRYFSYRWQIFIAIASEADQYYLNSNLCFSPSHFFLFL